MIHHRYCGPFSACKDIEQRAISIASGKGGCDGKH